MVASPLQTAILTRPSGRNQALGTRLTTAGWQVLEWPALHIEAVSVPPCGVPDPADFDLAVFVSGNAVDQYLRQLRSKGLSSWPASCVLGTVGPATAARLRQSGWVGSQCSVIHPGLESPRHDSEALWALVLRNGPLPRRVLFVRGTEGRDWLAQQMFDHGAQVLQHAVYRRTEASWSEKISQQLSAWCHVDQHPTWLLTSAAVIEAVRANTSRAVPPDWWHACRFIVTHPRLVGLLERDNNGAPVQIQVCAPADDAIFDAFVAGRLIVS